MEGNRRLSMSSHTKQSFLLQNHLLSIYKSYTSLFKHDRCSLCAKIYYPITVIDADVEETVVEAFTSLELTILYWIQAGKKQISEIEEVTGLPAFFIEQTIQQLQQEQLLDQFMLTNRGQYSLAQQIKYKTSRHNKKLQVDGHFNYILSTEQVITEQLLLDTKQTDITIPHVLPKPFIDLQDLKLTRLEFQEEHHSSISLRSTTEHINKVNAAATNYVEAILLMFHYIPHPYIFLPQNDLQTKWNLHAVSTSNVQFIEEQHRNMLIADDLNVYDLWMFSKLMRDDLKRKQENVITVKEIKAKLKNKVSFCVEEHITLTDSGINAILDFPNRFQLRKEHILALKSIELSKRNVPFILLDNEQDYVGLVSYMECYDSQIHVLSKKLVDMELQLEDSHATLEEMIESELALVSKDELSLSEIDELIEKLKQKYVIAK